MEARGVSVRLLNPSSPNSTASRSLRAVSMLPAVDRRATCQGTTADTVTCVPFTRGCLMPQAFKTHKILWAVMMVGLSALSYGVATWGRLPRPSFNHTHTHTRARAHTHTHTRSSAQVLTACTQHLGLYSQCVSTPYFIHMYS